jgi:hypothetical protein
MILLDILLVGIVIFSIIKNKEVSLLNPLLIFLAYHVVFVSIRMIQILVFDVRIISNYWFDNQITREEMIPALIASDFCLLGFYLGFIIKKRSFKLKGKLLSERIVNYKEKNVFWINLLLVFTIFFGLIGVAFFSSISGVQGVERSIYINMIVNSGVISGIMLVYLKGFKPYTLFYLAAMIGIFALQGEHRYRVVLPLILIASLYLKLKNEKVIPLKFLFLGVVVMILSSPLKIIGKQYVEYGEVSFFEIVEDSASDLSEGTASDLSYVEQSAAMISNVDQRNIRFYGETYVPILFFFVPRSLWQEKLALNDWQKKISTSGRDFEELGQISLLAGEGYANFGYFGSFIVPFFVGVWYSYLFYKFKDVSIMHKGFLTLLLFNMVIMQVWRDGLISLFLFPILNYFPIFLLILLKRNETNEKVNNIDENSHLKIIS